MHYLVLLFLVGTSSFRLIVDCSRYIGLHSSRFLMIEELASCTPSFLVLLYKLAAVLLFTLCKDVGDIWLLFYLSADLMLVVLPCQLVKKPRALSNFRVQSGCLEHPWLQFIASISLQSLCCYDSGSKFYKFRVDRFFKHPTE